jgi:aminoglycoside/choline kinase family phosphotransferase
MTGERNRSADGRTAGRGLSGAPLFEFVARATGLMLGPDAATDQPPAVTPLAGDGSRRKIYRVRRAGLRAVAIENPLPERRDHPDENEAWLNVREYLHQRDVRVPRFYAADRPGGFLLIEDLGDERLFDHLAARRWDGTNRRLYERALRMLVGMQAPGEPVYREAWTRNPAYDEAFILEQEAGYFHRELGGETANPFAEIEPECRHLASRALSAPVFMHRDFQSRNLMIVGEELAVIDFQGARLGPPGYDLAALLYDPYVALPPAAREELADFYREAARQAGVTPVAAMSDEAWHGHFLANAANRLMQALGAFGKLGLREGRSGFREHVPAGLALLAEVLAQLGGTPRLQQLVHGLQQRPAEGGDALNAAAPPEEG